jgi:SynChlorMet cassette protein ScmD
MDRLDKPAINSVAVLREEFDDWAVLFNPDTAEAVGVNPVGVFIWKLMDGKRTLDQIAAEVREHFQGVPESAEIDVVAFAAELEEKGFASVSNRE